MKKTCIIIVGPTAVGKTALAIALAKHLSTRIISADSRQCYKELNIGVAKPSPAELRSVQHFFIDSHSMHEPVNAAIFEKYALNKIQEIFAGSNTAVMVGGTGLYIKTFCDGLDKVPEITAGIREKIMLDYDRWGLEWLQQQVKKNDPAYFSAGEIQNPQRLIRALEIKLATGKSIVEFQTKKKSARDFTITRIGLELPREELYRRINSRTDAMIENGLLNEAQSLQAYQHLNALQTVGYKELFDHFEGKNTLAQAIESIKMNTRHYAKRQLTWFKKDTEVKWCKPVLGDIMKQLID